MSVSCLLWCSYTHSRSPWGRNLGFSLRRSKWLNQSCCPLLWVADPKVGKSLLNLYLTLERVAVECIFFFLNGNGKCVWSVGNRLWEEYGIFFYCRTWFLYFLNLSLPTETLRWFLVCVYFGIQPTMPDSAFCSSANNKVDTPRCSMSCLLIECGRSTRCSVESSNRLMWPWLSPELQARCIPALH